MKMKQRNEQLKGNLALVAPVQRIAEAYEIPRENSVNRQGYAAYALPEELRLIAMLNTCKLDPQAYRSDNEQIQELQQLVEQVALKDPYFVAQCICWSRCVNDGMRSINHLAAALLAPFISGKEWAKRFYSAFDKKTKSGGCIFRPDDMSEIKDVYSVISKHALTNAMKKGFREVIEGLSNQSLTKYSKSIIDISNLVHPNPQHSLAEVTIDGQSVKTIHALMSGTKISADTWEVAQSEAGQLVADAVKTGKLSEEEAQAVLTEQKNKNWKALLQEHKLGILAALRNVRNITNGNDPEVIELLSGLVSNGELIRKGLILPYQIDLAYEATTNEQLRQALLNGYKAAIPNLADKLPGKTCVIVDVSGSMTYRCHGATSRCIDKAALIAATVAEATYADIVLFGDTAKYYQYNYAKDVFTNAQAIASHRLGGTDLVTAFNLLTNEHRAYDRLIILSDNECNGQVVSNAYEKYIRNVCNPYVYEVDLAAYGTVPVENKHRVTYYAGYGYMFFEDISSKEFNPNSVIEEIRKYKI